jgi:hypothetical protein
VEVFNGVGCCAVEGARLEDGAYVWILFVQGNTVVLEMVVDVLGRGMFDAGGAAVDDFLLRQGHPLSPDVHAPVLLPLRQHFPLVDLELHDGSDCEDVGGISVHHVLDWRQEVSPIVVVIILELCDFQVSLGLGDGGDHVIEFLKLIFCEIGEVIDHLVEVLLELFIAEDHVLLRDEKDESVELLLVFPETIHVLAEVELVGRLCTS